MNFRIAEEFISSNIQGHTFPDTNDNDIKRSMQALLTKLTIHNNQDKVDRLTYLFEAFLKRPLRNVSGVWGYGKIHYSVLRLLLLVQRSPTDTESFNDDEEAAQGIAKEKRVYKTREELRKEEDQRVNELLKIRTEEDEVIDRIREEWLNECENSHD